MSDKELWDNIGKNVAMYRKAKKMTQLKLAELAHCSNNHINTLENSKGRVSLYILLDICYALDITLDRLVIQSTKSNRIPSDIYEELNTFTDKEYDYLRGFIPVIHNMPQ